MEEEQEHEREVEVKDEEEEVEEQSKMISLFPSRFRYRSTARFLLVRPARLGW